MSEDSSVGEVVELVSGDRILVRAIIREASRCQKKRSSPVFDLARAIQMLGLRRVHNLLRHRLAAS